jgi:polyferredoxin
MAGGLGVSAAYEASAKIQIGVPEITLIILFAVGFYGHWAKFKYTRYARWISMIVGLIILGFWLNRPLTIANINQILLGFWPAWQSHLYWYLLVFGVILVLTIDGKNPYCDWFCPFGAAQECLGVIGQAKIYSPGKFKGYLKWLQRGFAWLAIILALIFRNPSISSYEVFDALFARVGTTVSFTLLVIVLIASLLMKRPWCSYLCPVRPVTDFIHMLRRSAIELWKM